MFGVRTAIAYSASGAGKSTLLYALSGMDTPTLGTIAFKGKVISRLAAGLLVCKDRRDLVIILEDQEDSAEGAAIGRIGKQAGSRIAKGNRNSS